MHYKRNVRFGEHSESLQLLQKLYGPNTKVHVEQYVNEGGWPKGFGWEGAQAGRVIERWKENGMTDDDIGYLADVDEFFSRDFIRAMQICDVKQFDDHGNCHHVKIGAEALVFEGGPKCRTARTWYHPDLTIGACIETISTNSSLHPKPERGWKGTGWLDDGWTKTSNFHKLPKNATHFPLFNPHDFRRTGGQTYRAEKFGYNAFHLHNFFPNATLLRNKYKTYGEPVKGAFDMGLGEIHKDLQSMLNCAFNKTEDPKTRYRLVGLSSVKGPIPLGFQIPGYVEERMFELKSMLSADTQLEPLLLQESDSLYKKFNISTTPIVIEEYKLLMFTTEKIGSTGNYEVWLYYSMKICSSHSNVIHMNSIEAAMSPHDGREGL